MKVIAVANHKGGVGKTTTAVNLGACLAERDCRVLVIDFDPQASATSSVGVAKTPGRSMYGPLLGQTDALGMVTATSYPNLAIIPSEDDLAGVEIEVARLDDNVHRLRAALEPIRARANFQFVFIDCPPSLGTLMTNALAAADSVLVPLQCEYLSLEGLSNILRFIDRVRESVNPSLAIEGILMTMFDARTRLSQTVINEVRSHLGPQVFHTIVPRTVRLGEAPSYGRPITNYDAASTGAAAYRALAGEFLKRNKTA